MMVDWGYLGARSFDEPFFDQTISACLEHPFNLLFRHQTSVEVLVEQLERSPGLKPNGFIFHMSRSGSTLIARMLNALSRNIVISEAPPIDAILRASFSANPPDHEQHIVWLRSMLSALAQQRVGSEKHFFVKFEAWHALMLPLIRSAFPDVPWIFVYRDPVEVLVSQIEHLGQIVPNVLHYSLFGTDAQAVVSLPVEEYSAVVLATICHSAFTSTQQGGGLLINYSQLPYAVCSSISNFFNMSLSTEQTALMMSATRRHSKNPDSIFSRDSAKKNEKATNQIRESAERWLNPIYECLEGARVDAGKLPVHS